MKQKKYQNLLFSLVFLSFIDYIIYNRGGVMLIEFTCANYRSFRDKMVLSMEATGLGTYKKSLLTYIPAGKSTNSKQLLLPAVAIYGKNGGGKSNVIRAFWLAVQFVCNAQRTQHENAEIPVQPFLLNDYSKNEPTLFEFKYIDNDSGIKYIYSFEANKRQIIRESLHYAPKGKMSAVFVRNGQQFEFPTNGLKRKRKLIAETIAPNQLYFAVACTMNEQTCINAMKWFRESVFFSRGYSDFPGQLFGYSGNTDMLKAISEYAKSADVGIQDMHFDFQDCDISELERTIGKVPDGLKNAIAKFMMSLSEISQDTESKLKLGKIQATSDHYGINKDGTKALYTLQLADESDGTHRLMSLAPEIENVLKCGGLLLVDELERGIHPLLMEFIVSKFQSPTSNTRGAQIIFTTHNTELFDSGLLRKDQFYFTDKGRNDGASILYSISSLGTPTNENIRKKYLVGKYGATPELDIEEIE